MTTPTLEVLAERHESGPCCGDSYQFTLDQLRALITEAVGIVAGEPVAIMPCPPCFEDGGECDDCEPLHAIDIGRLG